MRILEALSQCGTVAESAECLAARPRWGTGLLMLADAAGELGALELSHSRAELRRPAAGEDILVHSNCYVSRRMCEIELSRQAVWNDRAPAVLRGRCVLESAVVRDRRFAELLAGQDQLGPDELATILV